MRMQFRVDFIVSSIGMILTNLTGAFSLWIIFRSIPSLGGWKYFELIFIYGFSLLALSPLQLFFDNIWSLRRSVAQGDFIKYYFKPINMMFYYMSEVFDLKGLSQLVFGICTLWIASYQLGLQWTIYKIILLPILVISASLVMISLLTIAAAAAFWIRDSFAIITFVFSFREHSRYPLTIFNHLLRYFLTYVIPVGFISYYPCLFFLRPIDIPLIAFASPVIGLSLFFLAYKVWERGVRVYSGTGT
jgi:ABC-2 type transport system permease protein